MSVAVVHDYFIDRGGAERVALQLAKTLDAPLFTVAVDPRLYPALIEDGRVHVSGAAALFSNRRRATLAFWALPLAVRSLDVRSFDVLVSSSSAFAHHVRKRRGALHVCYCYTPPRFLWQSEVYFARQRGLARVLAPTLAILRRLDLRAAEKVDQFVAISTEVATRIHATYGREAVVVPPPVDVDRFTPVSGRSQRFVVVSRLLQYKRIDLAIEAANRLHFALDIYGDGPDRRRLAALAGPTVRLLGYRPDDEVSFAMASSEAVIIPGREDFGLTVAEAQAAGRPPIAFAAGGALDVIEDGATGFLFNEQTAESLGRAIMASRAQPLGEDLLRASALRFSPANFARRMRDVLAWATVRRTPAC